jgi:hypothetical protein
MPFAPAPRMLAFTPTPLSVMAFVIVTPPKPPGSSTEISPPAAVFEIAPANVLHGAGRLHGLASSPTPDTQVRVACANANELPSNIQPINATVVRAERIFISLPRNEMRKEVRSLDRV